MRIVTRYKEAGVTVAYDVEMNNKIKHLDATAVKELVEFVENAELMATGEFRALKGECINTVATTPVLSENGDCSVRLPVMGLPSCQFGEPDCHGKEFIKVCRRLREFARKNNFTIDMSKHKANGGRNTQLFKLIEACDTNVHNFIRMYLYNIQPYSLSRFQGSRELGRENIWLSDLGYGESLIIKVNATRENNPVVISFHESNRASNYTHGGKDFSDKPCAVLVNKVAERPNCFGVDYVVQRGFIAYTIHSITNYVRKDVALVNYGDITSMFNDTLQSIAESLQRNYYDSEVDALPLSATRLRENNISFMALGFATANNISLLIDMFTQFTDSKSRRAISEITMNLLSEVPQDKLVQIKEALDDRFLGSRNKLYLAITDKEV